MMTINGALVARIPSMQAVLRPRRPMRRMQRTRTSCRAIARTAFQVPSVELSSTNTTSQAMSVRAARNRSTTIATLSRSFRVGMTMETEAGSAVSALQVWTGPASRARQ